MSLPEAGFSNTAHHLLSAAKRCWGSQQSAGTGLGSRLPLPWSCRAHPKPHPGPGGCRVSAPWPDSARASPQPVTAPRYPLRIFKPGFRAHKHLGMPARGLINNLFWCNREQSEGRASGLRRQLALLKVNELPGSQSWASGKEAGAGDACAACTGQAGRKTGGPEARRVPLRAGREGEGKLAAGGRRWSGGSALPAAEFPPPAAVWVPHIAICRLWVTRPVAWHQQGSLCALVLSAWHRPARGSSVRQLGL